MGTQEFVWDGHPEIWADDHDRSIPGPQKRGTRGHPPSEWATSRRAIKDPLIAKDAMNGAQPEKAGRNPEPERREGEGSLCLDGGRLGTRTPDLFRVKEAL